MSEIKDELDHQLGRPTKYKSEFAEQAYRLCLLGCTDGQLASFFEVDERTINNWKQANNDFFQSIKKGKEIADAEIVHKLYTRASGYSYFEITYEKIDKLQNQSENAANEVELDAFKKKIVKKEIPPDTTAAIFWLKNRQPRKWREKPVFGFDVNQLSEEDLDTIINKLITIANEQSAKNKIT